MKLSIWAIGKTDEKYLKEGIEKFLQRLAHYTKVEIVEFKDVNHGQTADETIKREATMILDKLKNDDYLVILDERGAELTSVGLSTYIEKLQNQSIKSCVMLIGGAFGHHSTIRERANYSVSLSKMTFSHQMVRLFLVEQIYRAFTIIKNEKYHNE
jgi:23S rRNA (pseudouridine1915-N3)-methyltransferase